MIGKRKRDAQVVARLEKAAQQDDTSSAQTSTVFQQYFESQFEPLQRDSTRLSELLEGDESDDVSAKATNLSDWEGLSEEDSIAQVEVIEYGVNKRPPYLSDDLQHAKAFMVRL